LKEEDNREDTEREERSVHIIIGSEKSGRLKPVTMK